MNLETLLAKQEIYEVLLRYCRGVDRCDRASLESVYHPNAVVEHGSFKGKATDFIPWIINRMQRDEAMMHCLGNVSIEIKGDQAVSEASFIGVFRNRRGLDETRVDHFLGARYVDKFAKQGQCWKKLEQVIVCDWSRLEPVGEESPLAQAYRKGLHSTRDFSYENRGWLLQ